MTKLTYAIGRILVPFLEELERLDTLADKKEAEGKKAVLLIMTINDIENLIKINQIILTVEQ